MTEPLTYSITRDELLRLHGAIAYLDGHHSATADGAPLPPFVEYEISQVAALLELPTLLVIDGDRIA